MVGTFFHKLFGGNFWQCNYNFSQPIKITIVNDTSKVIRMMTISDAPSCGITYDDHSDDSRDVIYAPRVH